MERASLPIDFTAFAGSTSNSTNASVQTPLAPQISELAPTANEALQSLRALALDTSTLARGYSHLACSIADHIADEAFNVQTNVPSSGVLPELIDRAIAYIDQAATALSGEMEDLIYLESLGIEGAQPQGQEPQ